jgi:hypothetical protein
LFDAGNPVEIGFWLLDTLGLATDGRSRWVRDAEDTVRFSFEADAAPGAWVYALEALDSADSVAGRARYAIDIDPVLPGPVLSDPVILRPFRQIQRPERRSDPGFRPVADLTFSLRDTLGVWVEAAGLTPGARARLRLSLQRANRSNLPSRLLGWIGRRIGLASPPEPVFVEWAAVAGPDGRMTFAFELPPQSVDEGTHVLIARLTEVTNGLAAESRRIIRYADPAR